MKKLNILRAILVATLIAGVGFFVAGKESEKPDKEKPAIKKQDKEVKKDKEDEDSAESGLKKSDKAKGERADVKDRKKREEKVELKEERKSLKKSEAEEREGEDGRKEPMRDRERGFVKDRPPVREAPPAPLGREPLPPEAREKVRVAIENLRSAGFPGLAERIERELAPRLGAPPPPPAGREFRERPLQPGREGMLPPPPMGMREPPGAPRIHPQGGEEVRRLHNQVAELQEQVHRLEREIDRLAKERR